MSRLYLPGFDGVKITHSSFFIRHSKSKLAIGKGQLAEKKM
jgi:hypothetical protein